MNKFLSLILTLFMSVGLYAHGGSYRGPRDIVPPGGGGNPGGPVTPGQPGGPGGPQTPTGQPGQPSTPTGPTTGPGNSVGPTTGPGVQLVTSDEDWTFWWEFNKDRYLNIKRHIHKNNSPISGGEEFNLGIINREEDRIAITRSIAKEKIYPVLVEVLHDKTRSPDELSSALIALAKLGYLDSTTSLSLTLFEEYLDFKNEEVAETAALSLGILGSPRAIPTIKSIVNSDKHSLRVKAFAIYGLGLINADFLEDQIEINEIIKDTYLRDKSATHDIKVACLQAWSALKEIHDTSLAIINNNIAKEKNDFIKAHTYTAYGRMLSKLNSIETNSLIIEMQLQNFISKSDDLYTRLSKIQFLGVVPTNKLVSTKVLTTLKDIYENSKTTQEKYFALISIGQLKTSDALNFLIRVLEKDQKHYKPWAALAIGICHYNTQFNDKEINKSETALSNTLLDDKAAERKGAYAIALGLMKGKTSEQLIIRDIKESKIQEYVGYCGLSLGLGEVATASNVLLDKLRTSKRLPIQLQNIAIGAALLQAKGVESILIEMLQEAKVTSVYAAIANALGFVSDAKSIKPLTDIIFNKDIPAEGRAFAIVALGIIGDRNEFNWNVPYAQNCNYRANTSTFTGGGKGILDIL